ncbi:uncharacterized protein LOC144446387 [Glandiceps talaboti]
MDEYGIQWAGAPCGQHGPYIFYKGFKYLKDGRRKILSLGEFFFVRCSAEDPICICELQLLWEDKSNNGQFLSSARLYFLPEDTPDGRAEWQGEDEVLAVSHKIILKIEDLVEWTTTGKDWKAGTVAMCEKELKGDHMDKNAELLEAFAVNNGRLNVKDIKKEKKLIGCDDGDNETKVVILSYPKYCRYVTVMKRIQHVRDYWLRDTLVTALGGFTVPSRNTRLLYCKDFFDHPTLPDNEQLCDHMAPNLKGRPRKKRLKIKVQGQYPSPNSPASPESSNDSDHTSPVPIVKPGPKSKNERRYKDGLLMPNIRTKAQKDGHDAEEVEFLAKLYKFMKDRNTPIERIPHLGFKQIDLFYFYKLAAKWGGYERVTTRKLWKHLYDGLGGNPGSTSAATCTRRHYERLILPYERYLRGEEDRPPPPAIKHRKTSLTLGPDDMSMAAMSDNCMVVDHFQYHDETDDELQPVFHTNRKTPEQNDEEVERQDEKSDSSLHIVISKDENDPTKMKARTGRLTVKEIKGEIENSPSISVKRESPSPSHTQNQLNTSSVRVQKTVTIDAIPVVKTMSESQSANVGIVNMVKKESLELFKLEEHVKTTSKSCNVPPATTSRISQSILSPLVRKKLLSSRSRSPNHSKNPLPPVCQSPSTPTSRHEMMANTPVRSETPAGHRPSVIQHTQRSQSTQKKETSESTTQSNEDTPTSNHTQAVQASDLILRHITQDQMALNRAFYAAMIRPPSREPKEVTPRKREYPKKTEHVMSPYYPYRQSDRSQGSIPKLELNHLQEPYYEKNKRIRLDSNSEDAQYYMKKFQNFASEHQGESSKIRSPGVAHGGALHERFVETTEQDQDQPCDLSLPKKRRESNNVSDHKDVQKSSRSGERVSTEVNEPRDLRTMKSTLNTSMANKLAYHDTQGKSTPKPSSEKKPAEARGSITQGVINTTVASKETVERLSIATGSSMASASQVPVCIPEYDPKLPPGIPHMMIPEYTNIPSLAKGHYSHLYQLGYPTHLLSPHTALLTHSHLYGAAAQMQATQQAYEELMQQRLVASQQLATHHAQFASQHLAREGRPSYVYPS